MRKITISDYTLRKLAEKGGTTLLFREKTHIAKGISEFGADCVELAEIKNVKEDTIIYKTICSQLKCRVAIPSGITEESALEAWECVKEAKNPCLQVILPVSTVQMEYMYHLKADKMEGKISQAVANALKLCPVVEFVASDASRADGEFLKKAVLAAVNSGASIVTICDDAGIFMPQDFEKTVKELKQLGEFELYCDTSDSIGLANANALASINAGADGIKCSFCVDGVLSTDDIAKALAAKGETLGYETNLKYTEIHTDIDSMLKKISRDENENKSKAVETGIFLDSQSTISDTAEAAASLGYTISDDDIGRLHDAVIAVCEKKSSLGSKELEAIIAHNTMQVPSTYHLESYITSNSSLTNAMSNVVLLRDGEKLNGVDTGDGPIDSAFRAIDNAIGCHYELDDFQIQAVTEGREALGSATVKIMSNGKLYSGNGLSSDIVDASIRAYINAINKIVYEEK